VHFVCSCHCIWCIDLSSPRRFGRWKFVSLLLLGSWNPRGLSGLCGIYLEPPIKLWRFHNLCGAFVAILGSLHY
jgi:hypothetical protein